MDDHSTVADLAAQVVDLRAQLNRILDDVGVSVHVVTKLDRKGRPKKWHQKRITLREELGITTNDPLRSP